MLTVPFACCATHAHAEPTAADKTLAAALFREGKALMDKNDFAPACAKLEESQRLDPGGGTLLNLALCHEKRGLPATAWEEFIEALGIARRDNRQARIDLAEEHIAKLEPTLSKVTIVVPPEADEPSLEITRDGAVVGRAAWGMPFPVDPGEHRVQATAPNKTPFTKTLTISAGAPATVAVRIPVLDRAAVAAPEAAAPVSAAAAPLPAAPPADRPSTGRPVSPPADLPAVSRSSAQQVWGWSAIGLGGAGLVIGTVLTVLAVEKKNDSHDRCPRDPCDAQAVSLAQDAGRFADFATVGFGVGFAALAAGVILLVTDGSGGARPQAAHRTWEVYPQVRAGARGEAGVGLRGQF